MNVKVRLPRHARTARWLAVGLLVLGIGAWWLRIKMAARPQQRTFVSENCPGHVQVKIHVSGEPISYQQHNDVDLRILAGGSNQQPHNSFYNPILVGVCHNIYDNQKRLKDSLPPKERKFADVFYRSSLCSKEREDLVAVVRAAVEKAGFKFVVGGKCGGTGYEETADWKSRGEWTTCSECSNSKLMLSFERFTPGKNYLSEKLFIPFDSGAIPVYYGNGHELMDLLTVNRRGFLDRINYSSDQEFANAIVALLRDDNKMYEMQQEPVFLDEKRAYNRVKFFFHADQIKPEDGLPEVYQFIRTNPKFAHLLDKPSVTVWTPRVPVGDKLIKALFNVDHVIPQDNECADIQLDWCCP